MRSPATGPGQRGWWPRESDVAEQRGPIVHALFRLSRKNRAMAAGYLRPIGLYPGQELLLLQLSGTDPVSQNDLVDALGLDHSTVTKMVQRLERAGVVAREQSARDRRVVMVRLTGEGRSRLRAVEDMWARLELATTRALSERQRAELLHLLRLVERNLDGEADRFNSAIADSAHQQVQDLER